MGDFSIGDEVAGYRIEELIARGGMGVVYRATHVGLDRPVALKVIARELADRRGFRERFLRESRLAARLEHPAVVPIYDSREVDGELVVAIRLVTGADLPKNIEEQRPRRCVEHRHGLGDSVSFLSHGRDEARGPRVSMACGEVSV